MIVGCSKPFTEYGHVIFFPRTNFSSLRFRGPALGGGECGLFAS
jgi:hypothetical protein